MGKTPDTPTTSYKRQHKVSLITAIPICNKRYTTTVLPAKSDSDVMFCKQNNQGLISIDQLCINPIRRIGLIHKIYVDSR